MSNVSFRLTFDGPTLDQHGMDVADLAPALLSLGELIKKVNFRVNGDAAKVNLIVRSDFQHACFQINLELIQSLYSVIADLIASNPVKTAKELAGWLDIISGFGAASYGIFKYLAQRNGREIERVSNVTTETQLSTSDDQGTVSIKFKGDNNSIEVKNIVYQLGEDPAIRRDVAKVVAPLAKSGIDTLRFVEGSDKLGTVITKEEALRIENSYREVKEADVEAYEPQPIVAHLQISRPDFNPEAKIWKFRYGDKIISVDVSETNIPMQTQARGVVRIGDTWRTRMTVTEKRTAAGRYRNEYKIVEVLDFLPAAQQMTLTEFLSDDDD